MFEEWFSKYNMDTHGLQSTGQTVTVQLSERRPQGVSLDGPPRDKATFTNNEEDEEGGCGGGEE